MSLFATDALLNPPSGRAGPTETFRYPPGRAQGAAKGGSKGKRQGRNAGREGRRQPLRRFTRDLKSQQASLPQWTAPVHAEAAAGKRTHTQVSQGTVLIIQACV